MFRKKRKSAFYVDVYGIIYILYNFVYYSLPVERFRAAGAARNRGDENTGLRLPVIALLVVRHQHVTQGGGGW